MVKVKIVGFKCSVCGELIDKPMMVELEQGICIRCMEELAEDVDEGSPLTDVFAMSDESIEEVKGMRFDER